MTVPPDIGAVIIGRNEGGRLIESIRSVQSAGLPVVYADSGSSDGSPAVARRLGVPTIELDSSRPYSAARGRNEGVDELQRRWPASEYVLFLDGDCILDPNFAPAAAATFEEKPDCAIVTGHLSERHPDASIYNRLCSIEWRSPAGRVDDLNLGGIMLARISAFRAVGGFRSQVIAGEEPDLAARLGDAGYTIFKIDAPMAVHDAEMLTFAQWWKRATRGGYGIAQLFDLHRRTSRPVAVRELRSAVIWAFALPLVTLMLLWPTHGLSLVLVGGYGLLGWRVLKHYIRTGLSRSDAWLITIFILCGKFPEFVGITRYCFNRLCGFLDVEHK